MPFVSSLIASSSLVTPLYPKSVSKKTGAAIYFLAYCMINEEKLELIMLGLMKIITEI